jgi:hypothetical protein
LVIVILSGCGGSGHPKVQWQAVAAPGFHFRAPRSWHVSIANGRTTVTHGPDFVQVATFPLARRYTADLFGRVRNELDVRMATVARQAKGSVSGHTVVTVDGGRSHVYDVRVGGRTDRYTFVLRGKREFLLLCSADSAVCDELAASFVAG